MPKVRKKISDNQSVSSSCKENKKLSGSNSKVKKKTKKNEKSYTTEALEQAMTAAGSTMSLTQAAREFDVPKSTLSLKIRYLIPVECKKGPPTVLSSNEEAEIVNWIMFCAEKGFPVNKTHLLDCVQNYLTQNKKKNPFTNNRPGKHWYNAFMKRHPSLATRIAQNLTSTRASVTESDLRAWFNRVQVNLMRKNLLSISPERIFNLDESAFMLVPKDNTVLTKKGAKAVYQIVSASDKACITTLITASASGEMAPPMVMFDCKTTPRRHVLNNIPKGWGVGHTESGWMSAKSFHDYIKNVFFKWLKEKKYTFPVVLYVDGHSSHCTLPVVKFCMENEIELISLYPNATHIIQPLDVALFRPLKESYAKELRKYRIDNNIVDVKKWMFAPILKIALEAIDCIKIVKNGFHASGLYPFNPNAVDFNVLNKTIKKKGVPESREENTSTKEEANSEIQKKTDLLKTFESDLIPLATLEMFRTTGLDGSWNGDIEQQGLFESWKKLNQLCGANVNSEEFPQEISIGEESQQIDSENSCLINFNECNELQVTSAVKESSENAIFFPKNPINIKNFESDSFEQNESIILDFVLDSGINIKDIDQLQSKHTLHTTNEIMNNLSHQVVPYSNVVILSNELSTESTSHDVSSENPMNVTCTSSKSGCDNSDTSELLYVAAENPVISQDRRIISLPKETFIIPGSSNAPESARTPPEWFIDIQQDLNNSEVLDLSSHSLAVTDSKFFKNNEEIASTNSAAKLATSLEQIRISNEFEKSFQKPCFNSIKKKKRKMQSDENTPVSCTVDDMLDILEKKESAKKLKEEESRQKQLSREKNKALKNTELNMKKQFNEKKKQLLSQKKELNLKIKSVKKLLKVNNEIPLQTELENLKCQLKNLEQSIKIEELAVLQKTLHIKKEIVQNDDS